MRSKTTYVGPRGATRVAVFLGGEEFVFFLGGGLEREGYSAVVV